MNMLEKILELPEDIVNNVYKYLCHPVADIIKGIIDKYET
jgi:hypothetical protein